MRSLIPLLLFIATMCPAQGQIRTVTRTVRHFGDLERKLATVDSAQRANYLTDDFEQRLCASPGTPVPREDWLKAPAEKFAFSQEAVHDYGGIATYSALATTDSKQFMVVDTWKKDGDSWKLSVRYLCPATGQKSQSTTPKRY